MINLLNPDPLTIDEAISLLQQYQACNMVVVGDTPEEAKATLDIIKDTLQQLELKYKEAKSKGVNLVDRVRFGEMLDFLFMGTSGRMET